MLTDKLFDFDFYKNSMSLFLKNSPGMTEKAKMLFDILLNVRDSQDKVFGYLDIFYYKNDTDNYITEYTDTSKTSSWLDLIGDFLEINRSFDILYEFYNTAGPNYTKKIKVNLTDEEFLIYIQASIFKLIFDGTQEMFDKYYQNSNSFIGKLGIRAITSEIVTTDSDRSAICNMFFPNSETYSDNLKNLFQYGFLTPHSIGIKYYYVLG